MTQTQDAKPPKSKLEGAMAYLDQLPRKLLRWACLAGSLWAMFICDIAGLPMPPVERGVILGFVCAVYGLRGLEKIKGVS